MVGEIKILVLTALFSLIASLSFAQEEVVYELGSIVENPSTWCGTNSGNISSAEYTFNGTSYQSFIFMDYKYKLYDSSLADEWVDITEEAEELNLFTITKNAPFATIGKNARLKNLSCQPINAKPEWYGRTIRIELYFKNSGQTNGVLEIIDCEFIGATPIQNGVPEAKYQMFPSIDVGLYDNAEAYVIYLCEGETLDMKIDNSDRPYGNNSSLYGNKYTSTYSWQREYLDLETYEYYSESNYKTGVSFTETDIATGTSKQYYYIPRLNVIKYNKDDVYLGECMSNMMPYIVRYNSPLKQSYSLNAGEGGVLNAVICNGEEFSVSFDWLKDGWNYGNVIIDLYATDPITGVESLVETIDSRIDYLNYDFGELYAQNQKNTIYKYRTVVYDLAGDVWDQDENGEWTVFTRDRHCPVEFEFQVEVKEMDAEITIGDMTEVCEDGQVDLTAVVDGRGSVTEGNYYTYEWKCDNAINAEAGVADLTLADKDISYNTGIRTYTFVVSNYGCEVESDPYEVKVNKRPVVTPVQNSYSTCESDEVVLGVTCDQENVEYTWTPQNGILNSDGSEMTINTASNPLAVGVYNYEISVVNTLTGCTSRTPAKIKATINGLPTVVSVSPSPIVICEGGSTTITANLDPSYTKASPIEYTWEWSEGGVAKSETTTNGQLTITPSETVSVSVTAVDKNGCKSELPYTFTVSVNTKPEFTLTPVDGCDGGTMSIFCEAGVGLNLTYDFTPVGSAPVGTLTGSVYTVNLTPAALTSAVTYEYTVKAVDNITGCEDIKSVEVVVNPLPKLSLTIDKPSGEYCFEEEITFTVSTAETNLEYSWDGGATYSSSKTYTKTLSIEGDQSFVVYARNKDTGCVNSASVTYKVTKLPDVVITSSDSEICEGSSATLTATSHPNMTYLWDSGATENVITTGVLSSNKVFNVVVTDIATGCKTTASYEMVVNKKPTFKIDVLPEALCSGDNQEVVFTPTVTNGVAVTDYQWSDASINGTPSSYSITKTWTANETFEVIAVSDKGCQSDVVSVTVKVNEKPEVVLTTDQTDLKYCTDEEITFTATATNVQYCWDGTMTNWVDSKTYTKVVSASETFTVYVKDKSTGCINSASVTYSVNAIPEVTITPDVASICEGENIVLSATDNVNFAYSWNNGATTREITVSPMVSTTYSVEVYDNSTTCSTIVERSVEVNKKPTFTVVAEPNEVCVGETSDVIFTINPTNVEAETASYSWVDGDVTGTGLNYTVNRTWSTTGVVEFVVYATTDKSCQSENVVVSVQVNELPELNEPIASPERICKNSGDEVELSASVVSGTNIEYEWYEGATSIGKGATIKVSPSITTTYSVIARDLSSFTKCESVKKSVTVEVDDAPVKPQVSVSNSTYCSNVVIDPILQITSPIADVTYIWYTSTGTKVGEGESLAVSPNETTSYYAVAKSNLSSGCESEPSDLVEVVINQAPVIKDELGMAGINPIEVCELGGILMYVTSETSNMEYTWSVGATGMVDSIGTDLCLYMGNPTESGYVTVVAKDQYGCMSNEVKYEIAVDKLPVVTLTPFNPNVCEGEPVTIDVSTDKAASDVVIMWERKNVAASSWESIDVANPASYTFVPEKDMMCQIYVGDNITGCITDGIEVPFNIIDALEISFTDVNGGGQYCKDNDMQITAVVNNAGAYTYSYEWYYGGVKVADGATFTKTGLQLSDAGLYTVKIVCNETGCSGEAVQEIIVRDKIEVHIDSDLRGNMVCFGQPLNLEVREEGVDYRWFVDGVEMTSEKNRTLVYPTEGKPAGSQITIKQVLTSSTGCPSDEVEVTYTVLDEFEALFSIKDGDNMICEDEEVIYHIDVNNVEKNTNCYNNIISPNCVDCDFPNVASYELFVNGIGQGEVVGEAFGEKDIPYIAVGEDDFVIYAQVRSIYGCEYITPAVDVKVSNISIDAVNTESGKTVYCIGSSDKIAVVASGAVNDNYNYEFIVDGTSVQSSNSSEYEHVFNTVGTTELKVVVTDVDAVCVKDTTILYDVKELPLADLYVNGSMSVDGEVYTVCHNEMIDLSVSGAEFVVEIDGVESFSVNYHENPGVATITPSDIDLSSYFSNKASIITDDASKLMLSLIGDYDDGDHTIRVKVVDPTTGCSQWSNAVTLHWRDEIVLSVPAPHDINTKLQLCLGEETTITPSAKDATSFTFTDGGSISETGTEYKVVASDISNYILTIIADNGCETSVEIDVVAAPDPKVEVWTFNGVEWVESFVGADGYYELCSDVETKVIAKGASSYNMNLTCDGVPMLTDFAYEGDQFEYDFVTVFDGSLGGLSDYNEYQFSYDMKVGSCEDAIDAKIKVFRLPEASMSITPGNVVITGTPITIDVTSGYNQYDFYYNGSLVQSGAESSIVSTDLSGVTAVKVVVHNAFGCTIELLDTISTLEGIAPKVVLQSSDYYCDDTDGVTVSIEDPQVGITYELVGLASGAVIKCEGDKVEWTNVKIQSGVNPTTYNVIAYHEALPDESVPMLNTVTIREVKVPQYTKLLPYNSTVEVCNNGDVLQIETSEVGVQYVLLHEDAEGNVVEVMRAEGNGGILDLMVPNAKGKYTAMSYGVNGDVTNIVCPVAVDGVYTYDIPEFVQYEMTSFPANGNICEGGDGVTLILSGSEVDRLYTVYKDGAPYAAVAPVVGNGNPIDFGMVYENGIYTIVSDYNGCSQAMSESVTVTLYSKPIDFEPSVSENGYFCENDGFVKISVAGQQESYVYKLMGTVNPDSPAEFVLIEEHIGDNSGAGFTFSTDINIAASYIVLVEIPNFDPAYGSCMTILGADGLGGEIIEVKEVSMSVPTIKVAKYEDDTYITERLNSIVVCEDEFVDIIVGQTEDKSENVSVEYKLYCNGVYVDSRFDESIDDNYVVFKKQPATSSVGVYKYHVAVEKKVFVDGVEVKLCNVDYAGIVETNVEIVSRPADRTDGLTEMFSVQIPTPIPGVCDPATIQIENAQIGKVYRLYRITGPGGDIIPSSVASKKAESTDLVFNVEGFDDWYVVSVSNVLEVDGEMKFLCEDFFTTELHVVDDRFLENHKIDLPTYVCHGDVVSVRMETSQVGVTYTLYKKDGEDVNGRPFGTAMTSYEAVNAYGFTFDYTISEDGVYFVEASGLGKCNTLMDGEFLIKFNSLPVSYELKPESAIGMRDNVKTYCGASEGIYVYLENSQDNVIYSLYLVKEDGQLEFIESKEGDTGNEIQFNSVLVDQNAETEGTSTYIVSARNKFTNCTSNMKGRIEVLYMPEITTEIEDVEVELNNCTPVYEIVLPEAELMQSALYSLVRVDDNGSIIAVDSKYASVGDIVFTIDEAGSYQVVASYEQDACEKIVGNVVAKEFFIDNQTLSHGVECDGLYRIYVDNSQSGVQYTLSALNIDNSVLPLSTIDGFTGYGVAFEAGQVQDTFDKFIVSAVHNECSIEIGSINISDLEIYPTISPAVTFEDVEKACSYDGMIEANIDFVWSEGATYRWIYEGVEVDSHLGDGSDYKFMYDASKPGVYELIASFNGNCETLVARRILEVENINIYNVIGSVSCEGNIDILLDGSDQDVVYNLLADSVVVDEWIGDGSVYDTSFVIDPTVTEYYIVAKTTLCTYEMNGRVVNTKPADIVASGFETIDAYVCEQSTYPYVIEQPQIGVTYYVVPDSLKNPTEMISVYAVKGESADPIELNLYEGVYSMWASYDNFECLTERLAVVTVKSLNVYDVVGSVSCEGNVNIELEGTDKGVTYYLIADVDTIDTWVGDGVAYQTNFVSDVSVNEYRIVASTELCEKDMNGRVVNTVPGFIEYETFDNVDAFVCESSSYSYVIETPQVGVTYYVVPDSVKSPKETQANYTIKAETAAPITFNLFEGVYSIWASYDNYECLTERWGVINIRSKSYIYSQLTSNQEGNCEVGRLQLYYGVAQEGVTYSLFENGICIVKDTVGNSDGFTFDVSGSGVVTYSLQASVDGECTVTLDEITVDFDRIVKPIASLDLYIEGELWTSADTAEICPEAFTSITADIQNVAIKEYNFYLNGVKYDRSNPISNTLIPTFNSGDSIVNIRLDVLTQAGCTFTGVDSLVVKVSNGYLDGTPLVAENNYPEYCEGDVGVRLAYLSSRKGEIYRLYKVGEYEDELIDIQEIPSYYIGEAKDSLWFDGWGDHNTDDYKAYAKAGEYYVTVEGEDGCSKESNHVFVVENPLPVTDSTQVYFAHTYKNSIDEWEVDTTTVSEDYGLLDTGHLILENALKGVTYTLYHHETDAELQVVKATKDGERLMFGPIINYKAPEEENDTIVVDDSSVPTDSAMVELPVDSIETPQDTVLNDPLAMMARYNKSVVANPEDWGEGIYSIIATNDTTGCTTEIGAVEFVEDQLVAYDVYLFLNKDQSIAKQSLYPRYPNKGNHKYIDWSSKVDMVWSPKVEQSEDGTYTIVEEDNLDEYEAGSGYTKVQSKANIVFEMLPTMRDSVFTVFDTIRSEEPIVGGDSVYVFSSYEYFKVDSIGFDTLTNMQIDTTYFYPSYVEGCDSIETQHYSYFTVDNYTDTVQVPTGTWGSYGFDNFSGSQDYDMASMSGMFVYAKRPSFYGQEVLKYRIYNKKMPSVRFSNEARIIILCGNQATADSSTVFLIPHAISPNGDGMNDVFKILLPYNYSNSESKLEVFNRWGTLVYRSSGTQYGGDCYGGVTPVDPVNLWDGTSKTSNMLTVGKNLPSGTYFYVYTITLVDNNGSQNTKKLSGYVELRH